MEFFFYFVFKKINFDLKEMVKLPPQLSYSVNEVLSEVAVRGDACHSKRTKARNEKTSVP